MLANKAQYDTKLVVGRRICKSPLARYGCLSFCVCKKSAPENRGAFLMPALTLLITYCKHARRESMYPDLHVLLLQ